MSWRKHETHKEETAAVKAALKAAGINAKVGHGRGTAWGWLEINIGKGQQFGEHERERPMDWCGLDCVRCQEMKRMEAKVREVVAEVTGRHGEYHGEVLILTQDHWTDKRGSEPIEHPEWEQGA
jgi:hypothetical protein